MVLDPLTGLDLLAYEQTIYQIPLDSDPVLAPAWNPQGRYGQILHPDNIPTVFSTLQAYNNAAPRTVDTLSTDGNKNLNVNIAANSGGGGGGGVGKLDMDLQSYANNGVNCYGIPTGKNLIDLSSVPGTCALISVNMAATIDPANMDTASVLGAFYVAFSYPSGSPDHWFSGGILGFNVNGSGLHIPSWNQLWVPPYPIINSVGNWHNWSIDVVWDLHLAFYFNIHAVFAPIVS